MKNSNRSTNLVKGLKVIQGKGFTRLKINGSTLTILDAPPKNNIDGHLYCNMNTDALPVVSDAGNEETVPLSLDINGCKRYYESNPSLIFEDIYIFQELFKLDSKVTLYGINPSGNKGANDLLERILDELDLSEPTLSTIAERAVLKGLGAAS